MCNHDQIAFLHKDEFFTGAKCINCSQRWGIEDIRDALRDADQLAGEAEEAIPGYADRAYEKIFNDRLERGLPPLTRLP